MEPIASYDAKGGDPKNVKPIKDKDGKHSAGLTTAGRYKLDHSGKHVSNTWGYSKIRWGVPIKESPGDNDVLFEDPPGQWQSVRKRLLGDSERARNTDVIGGLLRVYEQIAPNCTSKLPATWVFNDFGHVTWYMVRMGSGDKSPAAKPKTEGAWLSRPAMSTKPKIHNEFIHTTQRNVYQTSHHEPVMLEYSHGCVHIRPHDIDEMAEKGYLKAGNLFIVHKYDEKPMIKMNPAAATKYHRFQLHFFPGLESIVIYGY